MTEKRYTQKEDDWEILDQGKHLAYAHSAYQAEKIIETLNWKEEKIKELQERNNRQCELLEKQQEQIDNYIDIKAKLDGKIAEYTTKSEEYELGACACGSRKYAYKTDALIEFKEEVFENEISNIHD